MNLIVAWLGIRHRHAIIWSWLGLVVTSPVTLRQRSYSTPSPVILPAKAWEYVFTGVGLCVCLSDCDHDN